MPPTNKIQEITQPSQGESSGPEIIASHRKRSSIFDGEALMPFKEKRTITDYIWRIVLHFFIVLHQSYLRTISFIHQIYSVFSLREFHLLIPLRSDNKQSNYNSVNKYPRLQHKSPCPAPAPKGHFAPASPTRRIPSSSPQLHSGGRRSGASLEAN